MLAADNWCIKVNDRIYGPYSSQQLRKFAHEGRFAAWSLIAPAGSRDWREAREDATFASFFGESSTRKPDVARAFGKLDKSAPDAAKKAREDVDLGAANFVLVFDVVSGAASRVEGAVLSLGPAFRLADNVWTVNSNLTATGVRNAIAPFLYPRESIFVIDATRGRSAWQNYPPEAHAKITAAWAQTRH